LPHQFFPKGSARCLGQDRSRIARDRARQPEHRKRQHEGAPGYPETPAQSARMGPVALNGAAYFLDGADQGVVRDL
jgi:hypothetical protein